MATSKPSDTSKAEVTGDSGIVVIPTPPRIDLANVNDLRLEMARLYRDARHGIVEVGTASRLAYILGELRKMIEAGDLERRIELIESTMKDRRKDK